MKCTNMTLYALGGVEKSYVALGYWRFPDGYSTGKLRDAIDAMVKENPSIREIYQVDYRPEFNLEYHRSRKNYRGIESRVIFRDMLARDGWKVFG